jgi:hypothetical protein
MECPPEPRHFDFRSAWSASDHVRLSGRTQNIAKLSELPVNTPAQFRRRTQNVKQLAAHAVSRRALRSIGPLNGRASELFGSGVEATKSCQLTERACLAGDGEKG